MLDVSGAWQGQKKKMADNSEDPSSAKKLKKSNLCGPHNQYLSQPGSKIPWTTLRRWPKNFPMSTALPSDDLSTESIFGNDARLSGSFSIVTHDFTHGNGWTITQFVKPDCCSFRNGWLWELFSQYEDYGHEHGDQCDLLDGPLKPSESGLAEILPEDEQEGIKDYLMAFDSEESAGNERTDEQR